MSSDIFAEAALTFIVDDTVELRVYTLINGQVTATTKYTRSTANSRTWKMDNVRCSSGHKKVRKWTEWKESRQKR